jgi:hypothetical protein
MRPGFVGSYGLGPGRPAMRADTRENPVGKNGVMTTYTSSHTHTTRISKRKRDRGTHTTLAKWGSVSRKIEKNKIEENFPPVSTVRGTVPPIFFHL